MNGDHPLFAFAFRGVLWQTPSDLAEVDTTVRNSDFVWVHLTLAMTGLRLGCTAAPGRRTSSRWFLLRSSVAGSLSRRT
jgi:hypothetical protein